MGFKELEIATKRLSDIKVLESLIISASKKFEAEMIDLNTGQLEKGKLSTNKPVKPDYSPSYAEFKGFKTPDLKLEGDFYSGFDITFKSDSLIFDSSDSKADKLAKRYTDDIYGLTEDSKGEAGELIADEFIKLFENEFFK